MAKMKTLTGNPSLKTDTKQCAETAADPCSLTCIERPQFFYGQVLNDQDLNAVVGYTQKRLTLRRFVDGWGVTSGLHAHLGKQPLLVVVQPGTAIDCCGNDIVLCNPVSVDLSGVQPNTAECLPLEEERRLRESPTLLAVDLYITPSEQHTDMRTSLTRCSGAELQCEYSRIVEGGSIRYECISNPDELENPVTFWYDALESIINPLRTQAEILLRRFISGNVKPEDIWSSFTSWLAGQPVYEINLQRLTNKVDAERSAATIFSLMLIDRVNEFFFTQCGSPVQCDGVRVARVWLRNNNGRYTITYIDNQPPMRQMPGRGCLPVTPGSINIAPVIGQPLEEARIWLADKGIPVSEIQMRLPNSLEEFLKYLSLFSPDYIEGRLFAPLKEQFVPFGLRTLVVSNDILPVSRRVILFEFPPAERTNWEYEKAPETVLEHPVEVETPPAPKGKAKAGQVNK